MKILIVEDEPLLAMDLEYAFEDAGHSVVGPAASVDKALSLIENDKPDCACLDFNLRNETSEPIADALRALSIPYVYVTGQPGEAIRKTGGQGEIVLEKPADPKRVLEFLVA